MSKIDTHVAPSSVARLPKGPRSKKGSPGTITKIGSKWEHQVSKVTSLQLAGPSLVTSKNPTEAKPRVSQAPGTPVSKKKAQVPLEDSA